MKKIVFALVVLLLALPASAAVNISCAQDGNDLVISMENTGGTRVRAIALDIQLDSSDACLCDVDCVNTGYTIYPGQIDIDEVTGEVLDYGSCECDEGYPQTLPGTDPDSNGVTIEMGSLYVGEGNAPPQGLQELVRIDMSCSCGGDDIPVLISENTIRGGVVMEDPDEEPTVNITTCTVDLPSCAVPTCWDTVTQCGGQTSGDADCNGNINIDDLTALKAAWGMSSPYTAPYCCADFDQSGSVNIDDLTILKGGWGGTASPATGNQACP
jgi:hypothetical protein